MPQKVWKSTWPNKKEKALEVHISKCNPGLFILYLQPCSIYKIQNTQPKLDK